MNISPKYILWLCPLQLPTITSLLSSPIRCPCRSSDIKTPHPAPTLGSHLHFPSLLLQPSERERKEPVSCKERSRLNHKLHFKRLVHTFPIHCFLFLGFPRRRNDILCDRSRTLHLHLLNRRVVAHCHGHVAPRDDIARESCAIQSRGHCY